MLYKKVLLYVQHNYKLKKNTKESRDEEYVGVGVHEVSLPQPPTITSKTYLHVEQFS